MLPYKEDSFPSLQVKLTFLSETHPFYCSYVPSPFPFPTLTKSASVDHQKKTFSRPYTPVSTILFFFFLPFTPIFSLLTTTTTTFFLFYTISLFVPPHHHYPQPTSTSLFLSLPLLSSTVQPPWAISFFIVFLFLLSFLFSFN